MRPLTEEELKAFFEKLAKYIGRGIKSMLQRPDGACCFRLHQDRVYYVSERQVKLAASFPREKLMGMGTLLGKFSKTKKFRLHVTALDQVAQYAEKKVWVKPSAEQSFLYGNHVLKAGLGRARERSAAPGGGRKRCSPPERPWPSMSYITTAMPRSARRAASAL